jgi:hypothetical protein
VSARVLSAVTKQCGSELQPKQGMSVFKVCRRSWDRNSAHAAFMNNAYLAATQVRRQFTSALFFAQSGMDL